jgi:hypothetical protein
MMTLGVERLWVVPMAAGDELLFGDGAVAGIGGTLLQRMGTGG